MERKTMTGWKLNSCKLTKWGEVEKIYNKFIEKDGLVYDELIRGCLANGVSICTGVDGFYSYVFCEVYETPQSSLVAYKRYRKLPKKYLKLIEEYEALNMEEITDDELMWWEDKMCKMMQA